MWDCVFVYKTVRVFDGVWETIVSVYMSVSVCVWKHEFVQVYVRVWGRMYVYEYECVSVWEKEHA